MRDDPGSGPGPRSSVVRRADLLGAVGAGVLGAGLGALLARWLAPVALGLVLAGTALHAHGMRLRHRLDAAAGPVPLAWTALYWGCWIALGTLLASLLVTR